MPAKKEEGEVFKYVEDMKKESISILHKLVDIEGTLAQLQVRLEKGEHMSKSELLLILKDVREQIGSTERDDQALIGEEEEADTLLARLKKLFDAVV